MIFRDEGTKIYGDNKSEHKRAAVTKAYRCYNEMCGTPLMDDLPDTVVTTIRNEVSLYNSLKDATNWYEKALVMDRALQLIGNSWLEFAGVEIYSTSCQHLRVWLEHRVMNELIDRCELAVEREYERMQKEA